MDQTTTTAPPSAYGRLEERFRRIALVAEAESILHWDWSTMMPPGAAGERAEQITVLKTIQHGLLSEPKTAELLAAAEESCNEHAA